MKDTECVRFLQRALPRLRMRWDGFRRVKRQVCRRVERRYRELALPGITGYESYLETHPDEWSHLDGLCRITISRFYRDRAVWDFLHEELLPAICRAATDRSEKIVRFWSAGCGSGEEPYTLDLIWHLTVSARFPDLAMRIVATDADEALLKRARSAVYPASSLRDLPAELRTAGFDHRDDDFALRAEFEQEVDFYRQDLREVQPEGQFHLVLCRNLAFTYFDVSQQLELIPGIAAALIPGGALLIGAHERLPREQTALVPWKPELGVYRREE